jgi:predicted glycoside hydrolase/deacetylase ChbG (UPF0249 family)
MFVPHHSFEWLATLLDHVRFIGALINPFSIRKGVSVARSARGNTAVLEPEDENDSLPDSSTASPAMKSNLHLTYSAPRPAAKRYPGMLIINADDWGRDRPNTDRIYDCAMRGTVSSTSAMVFMEDSERAAQIAREHGIDAGLHLNLTSPLSATNCPPRLSEEQAKINSYLRRHRLAKIVPHPGLTRAFDYVVAAQLDEYRRLYGKDPERLDGHHHMHLCANVLFGKLLPDGIIVRRNFSFVAGEKSFFNRRYREVEDQLLAKRYRMVDFFFSLAPLEPEERLERLFTLARQHVVELETHPVNPEEHRFLMGDEIFRWAGGQPIASRFTLPL